MASTFATIEEAWSGQSLSVLPDNPYKNHEYQKQVLSQSGEFGVTPRYPQDITSDQVQNYLQTLYEDSGSEAVDALLPQGKKMKVESAVQSNVDPLPSPPQVSPDLIFFTALGAFLVWWILSSDISITK